MLSKMLRLTRKIGERSPNENVQMVSENSIPKLNPNEDIPNQRDLEYRIQR